MSADFDSEISPIHNIDHINYNTPHGDTAPIAHPHPQVHHVAIEEPIPTPELGKVEQSFMVGVFIICIILIVVTLWYVNFPPKPQGF